MAKRGTLEHPRTRRLARQLGMPAWAALGLLEAFWHWVGRYSPTGLLTQDELDDCADTIQCADQVEALIECGWIDRLPNGRYWVHSWHQHADNTVKKNLSNSKQSFAFQSNPEPSQGVVLVRGGAAEQGRTGAPTCEEFEPEETGEEGGSDRFVNDSGMTHDRFRNDSHHSSANDSHHRSANDSRSFISQSQSHENGAPPGARTREEASPPFEETQAPEETEAPDETKTESSASSPWWESESSPAAEVARRIVATRIGSKTNPTPYLAPTGIRYLTPKNCQSVADRIERIRPPVPPGEIDPVDSFWEAWNEAHARRRTPWYTDAPRALNRWLDDREPKWAALKRARTGYPGSSGSGGKSEIDRAFEKSQAVKR
jgi:hypothetical protein